MSTPKIGGSFAPPLTDELLAGYRDQIQALDPASRLREALETLLTCAHAWWEQPESTGTPTRPHPVGVGTIVELAPDVRVVLFPLIPWDDELKLFGELFDTIDNATQKPLRDAAYHLLWHANELARDREPITADKLARDREPVAADKLQRAA